ncbi:MAG: hypothetical protein U0528_07675 [Anaerolineae bacterium]
MYTKNELLFPHHAIPHLRKLRGAEWQELVDRVLTLPEADEQSLAFCLMMIRLNGCLSCETDSFRAMRGCDACSIQTLRRFKGSDRGESPRSIVRRWRKCRLSDQYFRVPRSDFGSITK